jgi:hypothetical protein
MFASAITTSFQSRSRAALATIRSLLLFEDDLGVDWEVDEEPQPIVDTHPHRERLAAAWRTTIARRAGQPPAAEQVCVCPLGGSGPHKPSPVVVGRLGAHRQGRGRAAQACGPALR